MDLTFKSDRELTISSTVFCYTLYSCKQEENIGKNPRRGG